MKNLCTKILVVVICEILFVSCSEIRTTQVSSPTEIKFSPTIPLSATPTETPTSIPPTETATGFEDLCKNSVQILNSEISPTGNWIVAECYGENDGDDSPLQVVNREHTKEWKVYFRDFVKGNMVYGPKNMVVPYRWTKGEKFLYVTSPSINSGCCWLGGEYVFLVQLNLETGEQTDILNGEDLGSFTISEDDHFLLFTPVTNPPYNIRVVDLIAVKTQIINLKFQKNIDLKYAVMSPYEDLIILPLFQQVEADTNTYRVDSIALIDLTKNTQKLLISGLQMGSELYPIRWMDKENVLLSSLNPDNTYNQSDTEYWLLNIDSGQLEKAETP